MFDIDTVLFVFAGYRMSLPELLATLTGLAAVWFAARGNILTWLFAVINAILFFALFYQINLYSAMALQIFFFCNSLYGWFNWRKESGGEKKPVTLLTHKQRVAWAAATIAGAIILGSVMSRIHLWLPDLFPTKATFVYTDAMIAVLSISASVLLAKIRLENWILWILVNIMSIAMYAMKGVMLVSLQYLIFLGMAAYGLIQWQKKYNAKKYPGETTTE